VQILIFEHTDLSANMTADRLWFTRCESREPSKPEAQRAQRTMNACRLRAFYARSPLLAASRYRNAVACRIASSDLTPSSGRQTLRFLLRRVWRRLLLAVVLFAPGGIRLVAQMSPMVWPVSAERESAAAELSQQDTIVLANFDNKTAEIGLDDAMTQALTMELSQSPFLNVLSDRKAREALGLVGQPTNGKITLELGQAICTHTASKAVVAGEISNASGNYLIGLTARACGNGAILAKVQFEAASQTDILKTLSEASSSLLPGGICVMPPVQLRILGRCPPITGNHRVGYEDRSAVEVS
jgi:hypothetical protein